MANVVTTGLTSIKVGDIAGDGGMGTTLAVLGYTNEGSIQFTEEDPTSTEFKAEEVDDPIYISQTKGKTTFSFQLGFPDYDQLVATLGGAKSGSGNAMIWSAPSTMPTIEKSIKIIPKVGYVLNIPRGKITGKPNGGFSKTDQFKVDVTITCLTPTKAGVAPYFKSLLAAEV